MTVRLSDYHDLPVIQALYEASGKQPYPCWSWDCNLHGWWLVCEDEAGRALGCLQLYLSSPQAFVDLLCVPTVFPKRLRAVVVKALCFHAVKIFKQFRVRTLSFAVSDPEWGRILTRYGARPVHHYPTYVMQVN